MSVSFGHRDVELLHHQVCAFGALIDKPSPPNYPTHLHRYHQPMWMHAYDLHSTHPTKSKGCLRPPPSSASEALTPLTSSSPWKFSPSLDSHENPHGRSCCHSTLQVSVADSLLCSPSLALQPCCLEVNFPRGVAWDAKRHSEVTRKDIHCQGSLADTGKDKVAVGLLKAFKE